MGKIVWLASYPKSGNTWMRVLLANYMRDADSPVDINQLEGTPIASSRLWFDEWVGVEASSLDDAVIERLRPEVYRCLTRHVPQTLYMKAHDAWFLTDCGEPIFPPDVAAGVVYILRNPLDLAASCANHWGIPVEKAVENLCNPAHSLSRSVTGLADQLPQRLGSWTDHVLSWVERSGLPVCLVRFEDLRRAPERTFSRVVRFCGLPYDEARIRKAVLFSDFSEMRRQEEAAGFRERLVNAPGPFFRRGEVGSWRDELPEELAARLIAAHGGTMRRFGYVDSCAVSPGNIELPVGVSAAL
jgi:hypothetical protein